VRGAQNGTPAITPEALSRVDSQTDQSSPFGMSNDPMSGLMESPFMKVGINYNSSSSQAVFNIGKELSFTNQIHQNLMSDSNFMREMIVNHPDMKKLAEENLEVAHMLQHPELFEASSLFLHTHSVITMLILGCIIDHGCCAETTNHA
jgi:hypothetical protein